MQAEQLEDQLEGLELVPVQVVKAEKVGAIEKEMESVEEKQSVDEAPDQVPKSEQFGDIGLPVPVKVMESSKVETGPVGKEPEQVLKSEPVVSLDQQIKVIEFGKVVQARPVDEATEQFPKSEPVSDIALPIKVIESGHVDPSDLHGLVMEQFLVDAVPTVKKESGPADSEHIKIETVELVDVPVDVVETDPEEVVVMLVEEVTTEQQQEAHTSCTEDMEVFCSTSNAPVTVSLSDKKTSLEETIAINTLLTELSAVEVHTYKVVPEGSQRRRPILIDSSGNKYNRKPMDKRGNSSKVTWTCNVRRKGICCHAKVSQVGDTFIPGNQPHNHVRIQKAKLEKPDEHTDEKKCQPTSTRQPKNIKFYMNGKQVPADFLVADVELLNARHLIFATPEQFRVLKKSKTLFADVSCKLVRAPFQQIFTLSTYLKDEDNVKPYAQVFVVMSRKQTNDYISVLEKIGELIPKIKVKKIILGYDAELWEAFDTVFPDVVLQGCVFHWTESVYMQIVNLGLNLAFTISSPVFNQIKELLALPFIPAEQIPTVFEEIASQCDQPLLPLIDYFRVVWINNPQWPIISWCVYGMATRTTTEVEGWHQRIVPKASINRIIGLLWEEAQSVTPLKKPMNFEKLTRFQKKCRTTKQSKLFKLWAKYESKDITLSQLLKSSYNINNPLNNEDFMNK
ncbi:uncharacterized protein [Antedon mediterranea]|uniref:uncharacterized protein n=1 Tax=Antedon mediterranea TaxID=105859 RepID=UPI003AF703C6